MLVNLLTEEHSRAGEDGKHHLLLEAYGYPWYRSEASITCSSEARSKRQKRAERILRVIFSTLNICMH